MASAVPDQWMADNTEGSKGTLQVLPGKARLMVERTAAESAHKEDLQATAETAARCSAYKTTHIRHEARNGHYAATSMRNPYVAPTRFDHHRSRRHCCWPG